MTDRALGLGGGNKPEPRRKAERQRHAGGDRLAMQQPVGKAASRFQRVTESVAEIEQRPLAGLALVARHDRGLGAAAHGDGVLARGTRACAKDVAPVRLQPGEEGGVAEQAVFGDLGVAGAEFARRQSVEHGGVGEHQDRLMERADQILAVGGIDRGLAADRGIDLRQQRGRHLHIIESAPHRGRREAGEIADDAAAERDHEIAALDARGDDRLADLFEHAKALRAFADRNDHAARRHAGSGKRGFGGIEVMTRDILVGDDGGLGARPQRFDARAERGDQPAPDDDVVAAGAERDLDGRRIGAKRCGHAPAFRAGGAASFRNAASAVIMSATMASCGTSRDCTVRSACA